MQNLLEKINEFNNNFMYMNNSFLVENFKLLTKVLPILKIQVHHNDICIVVKKKNLVNTLIFF